MLDTKIILLGKFEIVELIVFIEFVFVNTDDVNVFIELVNELNCV